MKLNQEQLAQLHEAAKVLRDAIEKFADTEDVVVMWASLNPEEDQATSGITLGDAVSQKSLSLMSFNLLGRAYNMLEDEPLNS